MDTPIANDNSSAMPHSFARLDGLIAEIGRYNLRSAQGHIEPFPYTERKAKLIGIAQELINLQPTALPPYATQAARQLREMLQSQEADTLKKPDPKAAVRVAEEVGQVRRGVMPRRPSHKPEERWHINQESEQQLNFLRQFIADVDRDCCGSAQCRIDFPHITQYRQHAQGILLLHEFARQLRATIRPYFEQGVQDEDFIADLQQGRRSEKTVVQEFQASKDEFSRAFNELSWKEPYQDFYADIYAQVATGFRDALASRQQMRNFVEGLDYQACSHAHKSFKAIGDAYKEDRSQWRMRKNAEGTDFADPRQKNYLLLEPLTRARWAMAADEVGALWKSNARILGDSSIKPITPEPVQGRLL